ncbi:MAG: 30S ribosomal protein S6 [Phycisphaerales bacterium]|jgi:ribosomal protein S6|nr:30S ribosomal protein S6 [Phycisphaeraceae bacterium]
MRSNPKVNYEAMLLFGQSAATDLKGAVEHVKEVLTKNGAEIIALKKWADRPLAYPIAKQKRGIYLLTYFSATTDKLGAIERAFNLSETVLRQLIIRVDHLSAEEMQNNEGVIDLLVEANLRAASMPTPAPALAAAPAPAAAPVQ